MPCFKSDLCKALQVFGGFPTLVGAFLSFPVARNAAKVNGQPEFFRPFPARPAENVMFFKPPHTAAQKAPCNVFLND